MPDTWRFSTGTSWNQTGRCKLTIGGAVHRYHQEKTLCGKQAGIAIETRDPVTCSRCVKAHRD